MTEQEKRNLEAIACRVRKGILDATHAAKSGHPGLPLGAAPMAYTLWSRFLKRPSWYHMTPLFRWLQIFRFPTPIPTRPAR